jgi:tRNA(fMet)-specific endonuclease VapC
LVNLISELQILPVDHHVAHEFGRIRAGLLDQGRPTPEMDLFIASTALAYDLTLVTHNVADFQHLPELRLEDWIGG